MGNEEAENGSELPFKRRIGGIVRCVCFEDGAAVLDLMQ